MFLMIIYGTNKWFDLIFTGISALSKGITSNNNGGFYCLNLLSPFRTINRRESYAKFL